MKNLSDYTAIAIAFLCIFSLSACGSKTGPQADELAAQETVELDSVEVEWNLYPERWNLNGDTLWVINSRDSLFLSGYDIDNNSLFCYWGKIGNGPEDYVSPGIVEGCGSALTLYGNTERKVAGYRLDGGIPVVSWSGELPLWNTEQGLPKPYTRLCGINDTICVGTYFLPRKVGADIINIKSGELLSEITLGVNQPDEAMSKPFQFKAAAGGDKIAMAYRYIDRIELYSSDEISRPTLVHAIGNSDNIEKQSDLYEKDRDDEMIKYYSDVQCDDRYAYLLWHGVEERNLETFPTYLRIYDLATGNNKRNIKLDRYFTKLLTDGRGNILLWSPHSENSIFMVRP